MKLTMMTRRISAALLAAVLCAAAAGCGVKVNPGTSDPQPDTPSSTTSDGSLPDSSADTSDEPTSGTDAASGTENSSRTSSSQGGTKATSGSSQSSGQSTRLMQQFPGSSSARLALLPLGSACSL